MARLNPIKDPRATGRVAFLLCTFGRGGVQRVVCNLASAFSALGLSIDLLLLEGRNSVLQDVPAGVRVVDLETCRRSFQGLPAVARYLRRERPDAIISSVYPRNLLALWARALTRVPTRVIVSEHGMLSTAFSNRRSRTNAIAPALIRWTYPLADQIVAVSESVADDLCKISNLSRRRIQVVHNPVIGEEFDDLASATPDHPWFVPGGPPVILAVGSLAPWKDFATLVRAFARLRETHRARLVILGEGQQRAQLEHLVRGLGLDGEVALPGFRPNPYAFMARASVFVLSSVEEGFGNVIVEALASGCPVVSTNCPGGPAEILDNGRYGRLVPAGDVEAMARAITETLDSPPDDETLRARGREFTAERSAAEYLALLGLEAPRAQRRIGCGDLGRRANAERPVASTAGASTGHRSPATVGKNSHG